MRKSRLDILNRGAIGSLGGVVVLLKAQASPPQQMLGRRR